MAYLYDPETGEITDDGTEDVAPGADYDETPIEVEPEPSEEDRRFEEDWDDMVAGRLTIDDIAAQHPTSIWDRVASGSGAVRDWALKQIKAAGSAALKSVTKPDGSIDWGKVASVGVGLAAYGSANRTPAASGYQGAIPKLTGERAAVPGTYDPNRAAGSSGQRYFSDVVYGDSGSVEARAARAREQAAGLASLNASNSARRAPLTYNLRPPTATDNIGAARPATPVGAPGSGGGGASAGTKPGFVIGGAGGNFDPLAAVADMSATIQRELSGLTTDTELDRYLATTQRTPEQLANATGYRAEDIAARMSAAWQGNKQTTREYLDSAYKPTSTQAPVAGAVIGFKPGRGNFDSAYMIPTGMGGQMVDVRYLNQAGSPGGGMGNPALQTPTPQYTPPLVSSGSSASDIANLYRQYVSQQGGDTESNRNAAIDYLRQNGVSDDTMGQAYQQYVSANAPVQSYTPAPAAAFDSAAYLAANPDVAAAGMDAAQHYAQYGQSEGRSWAKGGPVYAKGGAIPRGLAGLPQNTIYRAKGGPARYLRGETNGQADKIETSIDGKQPAALSHGEFVVPADVVSALGGGNSDAGAKTLYSMMDRVRHQAHGTKKQMRQVDPAKVLPS